MVFQKYFEARLKARFAREEEGFSLLWNDIDALKILNLEHCTWQTEKKNLQKQSGFQFSNGHYSFVEKEIKIWLKIFFFKCKNNSFDIVKKLAEIVLYVLSVVVWPVCIKFYACIPGMYIVRWNSTYGTEVYY